MATRPTLSELLETVVSMKDNIDALQNAMSDAKSKYNSTTLVPATTSKLLSYSELLGALSIQSGSASSSYSVTNNPSVSLSFKEIGANNQETNIALTSTASPFKLTITGTAGKAKVTETVSKGLITNSASNVSENLSTGSITGTGTWYIPAAQLSNNASFDDITDFKPVISATPTLTNITAGTLTTTKPSSGQYIKLSTGADSRVLNVFKDIEITKAGYIKAGTLTDTTINKTINMNASDTYYLPISVASGSGNTSVSLSASSLTFTPTISLNNAGNLSADPATTTKPTSGSYIAVKLDDIASKTSTATGTGKITTAGYLSTGNLTSGTATVTASVNTDAITYIPIPKLSMISAIGTGTITNNVKTTSVGSVNIAPESDILSDTETSFAIPMNKTVTNGVVSKEYGVTAGYVNTISKTTTNLTLTPTSNIPSNLYLKPSTLTISEWYDKEGKKTSVETPTIEFNGRTASFKWSPKISATYGAVNGEYSFPIDAVSATMDYANVLPGVTIDNSSTIKPTNTATAADDFVIKLSPNYSVGSTAGGYVAGGSSKTGAIINKYVPKAKFSYVDGEVACSSAGYIETGKLSSGSSGDLIDRGTITISAIGKLHNADDTVAQYQDLFSTTRPSNNLKYYYIDVQKTINNAGYISSSDGTINLPSIYIKSANIDSSAALNITSDKLELNGTKVKYSAIASSSALYSDGYIEEAGSIGAAMNISKELDLGASALSTSVQVSNGAVTVDKSSVLSSTTSSVAYPYAITFGSSNGSATPTASHTQGYVTSTAAKTPLTGTAKAVTVTKPSNFYIKSGSVSVTGNGLSGGGSFTPEIFINTAGNASGIGSATTSKPNSGKYIAVRTSSQDSKVISQTNPTIEFNEGYISDDTTQLSVTKSSSTTVGLNQSAITYIPLTNAGKATAISTDGSTIASTTPSISLSQSGSTISATLSIYPVAKITSEGYSEVGTTFGPKTTFSGEITIPSGTFDDLIGSFNSTSNKFVVTSKVSKAGYLSAVTKTFSIDKSTITVNKPTISTVSSFTPTISNSTAATSGYTNLGSLKNGSGQYKYALSSTVPSGAYGFVVNTDSGNAVVSSSLTYSATAGYTPAISSTTVTSANTNVSIAGSTKYLSIPAASGSVTLSGGTLSISGSKSSSMTPTLTTSKVVPVYEDGEEEDEKNITAKSILNGTANANNFFIELNTTSSTDSRTVERAAISAGVNNIVEGFLPSDYSFAGKSSAKTSSTISMAKGSVTDKIYLTPGSTDVSLNVTGTGFTPTISVTNASQGNDISKYVVTKSVFDSASTVKGNVIALTTNSGKTTGTAVANATTTEGYQLDNTAVGTKSFDLGVNAATNVYVNIPDATYANTVSGTGALSVTANPKPAVTLSKGTSSGETNNITSAISASPITGGFLFNIAGESSAVTGKVKRAAYSVTSSITKSGYIETSATTNTSSLGETTIDVSIPKSDVANSKFYIGKAAGNVTVSSTEVEPSCYLNQTSQASSSNAVMLKSIPQAAAPTSGYYVAADVEFPGLEITPTVTTSLTSSGYINNKNQIGTSVGNIVITPSIKTVYIPIDFSISGNSQQVKITAGTSATVFNTTTGAKTAVSKVSNTPVNETVSVVSTALASTATGASIDNYVEALYKRMLGKSYSFTDASEETIPDVNSGGQTSNSYVLTFPYSGSFFNYVGSTSQTKGSAIYQGTTYNTCLKMESSTSITFTTTASSTLTMVFGDNDTKANCKIDNVSTSATSGKVLTKTLAAGSHTITKQDSCNLFYLSIAY